MYCCQEAEKIIFAARPAASVLPNVGLVCETSMRGEYLGDGPYRAWANPLAGK